MFCNAKSIYMIISHGCKLGCRWNKLLAVYVELGINRDIFSSWMRLLLGIFMINLHTTLYLRLPIYNLVLVYSEYLPCLFMAAFLLRIHDTFRWSSTQSNTVME